MAVMRLPSDPPLPGEWFCFPQSVILVDPHADPAKEHRWIVVGNGYINVDIPVLLRSTKSGYGGIRHEAHNGSCSYPSCRIDEQGWISDLHNVHLKSFIPERKSCDEPSVNIIEQAMAKADQVRRFPKTRKSK